MTKMNDAQQELLARVRLEAERSRVEVTKLEEQLEVQKWEARKKLRDAVQKASDHNVPVRQIGAAMGTKDYTTVKGYLREEEEAVKPVVKSAPKPPLASGVAALQRRGEKEFIVSDTDGTDYEFWVMDFDGIKKILPLNATNPDEVPASVISAILVEFPGADMDKFEGGE